MNILKNSLDLRFIIYFSGAACLKSLSRNNEMRGLMISLVVSNKFNFCLKLNFILIVNKISEWKTYNLISSILVH